MERSTSAYALPSSDYRSSVRADEGRFRPSEYTSLLIDALRRAMLRRPAASVVEIGTGSGAVLAAAAAFGARSLHGVDVEEAAVECTRSALSDLQIAHCIVRGDLWDTFGRREFDMIVANLPHFPMQAPLASDRCSSWSYGGSNGRMLLDRFLDGLPEHMAARGRALITHNGFVGLEETAARIRVRGLGLRVVSTATVHIAPDKAATISTQCLRLHDGTSLHRFGPYLFGTVHVAELFRLTEDDASSTRSA